MHDVHDTHAGFQDAVQDQILTYRETPIAGMYVITLTVRQTALFPIAGNDASVDQ